jgi:hypothetical protein
MQASILPCYYSQVQKRLTPTHCFGLALANERTVSCGSAKEFKVYQIRMHYITKNLVSASGFKLNAHWVSGTDVVVDTDTQAEANAVLALAETNWKLPLPRPYHL